MGALREIRGGATGDSWGIRGLLGGFAQEGDRFWVGLGGIRPRPLNPFLVNMKSGGTAVESKECVAVGAST